MTTYLDGSPPPESFPELLDWLRPLSRTEIRATIQAWQSPPQVKILAKTPSDFEKEFGLSEEEALMLLEGLIDEEEQPELEDLRAGIKRTEDALEQLYLRTILKEPRPPSPSKQNVEDEEAEELPPIEYGSAPIVLSVPDPLPGTIDVTQWWKKD